MYEWQSFSSVLHMFVFTNIFAVIHVLCGAGAMRACELHFARQCSLCRFKPSCVHVNIMCAVVTYVITQYL